MCVKLSPISEPPSTDDVNMVFIWDWIRSVKLLECQGGQSPLWDIRFNPFSAWGLPDPDFKNEYGETMSGRKTGQAVKTQEAQCCEGGGRCAAR